MATQQPPAPSQRSAPPGPFRPGFFRSPLRGTWLTSVFGAALLAAVPIVFITGLLSYAAYDTSLPGNDLTPNAGLLGFYLFDFPAGPRWLYRLNQGTHVTVGLVLIPIVLAKLWSVLPRFFAWPPFRSPAQALERLSVAGLVGAGIVELVTGVTNIQYWYVVPGGFYQVHLFGAWVFMACFAIHVALKFPTMRAALKTRRLRDELKVGVADTVPEPVETTSVDGSGPGDEDGDGEDTGEDAGLVSADPAPATMSRRVLLGTTAAGAATLGVMGAAQNLGGPVRSLGVLAPRGRNFGPGPNGFPVNKTAEYRGVTEDMAGDSWALALTGPGGEKLTVSRADLLGMRLHGARLPIACVEGWSTGNQDWEGVRLAELAALVGGADAGLLKVGSLQDGGAFASSAWDAGSIGAGDSLLALAVNGTALSLDHGFPARIVVPASPGVRNTKWVSTMSFEADS